MFRHLKTLQTKYKETKQNNVTPISFFIIHFKIYYRKTQTQGEKNDMIDSSISKQFKTSEYN